MGRSHLFLYILIFFTGIALGFFLWGEERTTASSVPIVAVPRATQVATSTFSIEKKEKEIVLSPTPTPTPVEVPIKVVPKVVQKEPTQTITVSPAPKKVTSSTSSSVAKEESCTVFPSDNPWNQDISNLPVHKNSANYIERFAPAGLHADFGGNGKYGIPFNIVSEPIEKVPVKFVEFPKESDVGPYVIPKDPLIETGSDGHLIVFEKTECKLYELYRAVLTSDGWTAGSGAIFDLTSNALRPDYLTSADAAGLPIYPGLVKYDEVASGEINHALRFTLSNTQKAFIHPATHYASASLDEKRPPMGARFRLKQDYDLSKFHGQSRVILESLKKYGMILADNGTSWYITGARDSRWNDDDLEQLRMVKGSDMEVVDTGEIIK